VQHEDADMKQKFIDRGLRLLTVVSLIMIGTFAQAQQGQRVGTEAGKPPYNIIFVISDQRAYRLFARDDYSLPGIDAIARHGVTFRNHYILLYTDEEEQIFEAMRPIAINAIGNVVIRGDLADRSIFITLMLIPDDQRQPEDEF
jgi:hypothetical protein